MKNLYFTDRKKYYQKLLGDLQGGVQSLQALRTKYEKDYLAFYDALSGMYKIGPQKKAANEAYRTVRQIIKLLDGMIQGNSITAQGTAVLYNLVGQVEEKGEYFAQQSLDVKALSDRMEQVAEDTGVSLEDLSVTPELARKAVRRDVRRGRSQAVSTLAKQFPKTRGVGSQLLGGVGAAAAGPFTPFLKMGLGAGRDILGLTGTIARLIRESKQARFASQLRPTATGVSIEEIERMVGAREEGPALTSLRGVSGRRPVSVEEQIRPLQRFFDKGAYRAKWTKDLLTSMRDLSHKLKTGPLGMTGLTQKFKDLGLAIGPFLGKTGLYASLAVGVGLSVKKFSELDSSIDRFLSAQKKRQKAAESLANATQDKLNTIKQMGMQEYSRRVGRSPAQIATDIVYQEQRATLEQWASRPWYQKTADFWLRRKPPELQPFYERRGEIEQMTRPTSRSESSTVPELVPSGIPGMTDLTSTIKELITQLKKEQFGSAPTTGMGDPYDSADSLLGPHSDGEMTLGD